jgi:hypothetical protein
LIKKGGFAPPLHRLEAISLLPAHTVPAQMMEFEDARDYRKHGR